MNKDIGFLFKKDKAYRAGLNLLLSHDPLLAAYVELVRNNWSERLISARNELDHNGWTLPRTRYDIENPSRIFAVQPLLDGTPVVEFVQSTLDRLLIFTEEFLVHSFRAHMPDGADVAEITLKLRSPQAPERFRLTLRNGVHPGWRLAYSTHGFEQT